MLLEAVLQEVERAIDAKAYFVALMATLALPDICAALEDPSGVTTRTRYKEWFSKHLGEQYPLLSAEDCYRLRCGVVHQGKTGQSGGGYEKVKFSSMSLGTGLVCDHNVLREGSTVFLNLDIDRFCSAIISAVRSWYALEKNNPNVVANIDNVMRPRPMGVIGDVIAFY